MSVAPNPTTTSTPIAMDSLITLWKFSRPHTIIGTTTSILSIAACASRACDAPFVSSATLAAAAWALLPSLCMNVYIVGLNQVYDVDIDRINKPNLPIPAGRLSLRAATQVVAASLALSLLTGVAAGSSPLLWTLVLSGLLGTAYSLPPIRLKQYPFAAAMCIMAVRGAIVQLGFYAHTRAAIQAASGCDASPLPWPLLMTCVFITVFSVAIALLKDVPDIEGDRKHSINSFSVRMGAVRIVEFCRWLLTALYAAAAVVGLAAGRASGLGSLAVIYHASVAAAVWWRGGRLDARKPIAVYREYMGLWALFYAEYLVFPLMF